VNRADHEQLPIEFDRQIENLIQKGYPKAAGVKTMEFLKQVEPLKKRIKRLCVPEIDLEKGLLPFVIVIKSEWVTAKKAMSLVKRQGKNGYAKMYPREPKDFKPLDSVSIPPGMAYLLVDIDRGKGNINKTPDEALEMVEKKNRSPLTIDEGMAIVTHYPEFLMKNNCFSLLASRHSGDRRVPAIWIDGEKKPRLGWCWTGNPHTWLGSASCGSRVGL
jgi:hypothetical protein